MAFSLLPEQKPLGILSPDSDVETDLWIIAETSDQFGRGSTQYKRALQEGLKKYGGPEGFAKAVSSVDAGKGNFNQAPQQPQISGEELSITIPASGPKPQAPPTPGQKPGAGINDPMSRLGTTPQNPDPMGRLGIPSQSGQQMPPTPQQKPQQGRSQGQTPQQPGSSNFFNPNLDTVLGGLAAGAAQAGNMPHFGAALASAAGGGQQAMMQAREQASQNALRQAQARSQLLGATQQNANLPKGFEVGPNGEVRLMPGYAKAKQKSNAIDNQFSGGRLLSIDQKRRLVENGQIPESMVQFPIQQTKNGVEIMQPSGINLKVGKDGEVSFSTGSGSSRTTANETRQQERVDQSKELINNLQVLDQKIAEAGLSGAGPVGAFKGFMNETVANFAPGAFSQDREAFENWAKQTRESALRFVTSDDRFSNVDRQYVMDMFPSTGVFESPQSAAAKVNTMTAFMLKRLQDSSSDLNLGPQDVNIKPEKIREFYNQGYLTEDEAARTLEMIFPEQFGGNNG